MCSLVLYTLAQYLSDSFLDYLEWMREAKEALKVIRAAISLGFVYFVGEGETLNRMSPISVPLKPLSVSRFTDFLPSALGISFINCFRTYLKTRFNVNARYFVRLVDIMGLLGAVAHGLYNNLITITNWRFLSLSISAGCFSYENWSEVVNATGLESRISLYPLVALSMLLDSFFSRQLKAHIIKYSLSNLDSLYERSIYDIICYSLSLKDMHSDWRILRREFSRASSRCLWFLNIIVVQTFIYILNRMSSTWAVKRFSFLTWAYVQTVKTIPRDWAFSTLIAEKVSLAVKLVGAVLYRMSWKLECASLTCASTSSGQTTDSNGQCCPRCKELSPSCTPGSGMCGNNREGIVSIFNMTFMDFVPPSPCLHPGMYLI